MSLPWASDGPAPPDIHRERGGPYDGLIWGEPRPAGLYIPRRPKAGASQARLKVLCIRGRRALLHKSAMASSMMVSTAAVARATPPQSNMVAPFTGLRSSAAFPVTRRASADFSTLPSNGGRVQCMQVWPPEGKKKFETLSYLPDLSDEDLSKEVAYLLRNGWVPCIEFCKEGFVSRKYNSSPGYYDGRYWTMWKLPMFGCTDPSQVMKEVYECKKAYPNYFNRIIGFDNVRQVQCISFIAYKPPGTY